MGLEGFLALSPLALLCGLMAKDAKEARASSVSEDEQSPFCQPDLMLIPKMAETLGAPSWNHA